MGTSLALVGDYILAGQLGPASDVLSAEHVDRALTCNGKLMRPYVNDCQDLPGSNDGYAPIPAFGICITAKGMNWLQRCPFRPIAARIFFTKAGAIDLPDYTRSPAR